MFGFNMNPPQPTGESTAYEKDDKIPFYQASQDLGKLMLETYKENISCYYRLLGLDEDGKKQIDDPLMNKKGATILYLILSKINCKETFLTKITDYDVIINTHRLWKEIIKLLIQNQVEWKLPEEKSKWSAIREIIVTPCYNAWRRGENGLEKEFFKATHESKSVIKQDTAQQFKRGGFFG